ncbi:carbohydrate ABC transporter permease [Oceanispirochaeta crateris]|uniref:Carbohydrate ABC transporter permease n=1 Tax=Oceanispirochaeta crateris TaxID=2518645 RepID=A0A5C1QIR0_9SPIO|nr:carbohydrate ABC transporter permease [Oceanispirochaeta crateris]QEN08043.1 carbohydrate ABC transporter permease [Oceanispirochaeta crateris]
MENKRKSGNLFTKTLAILLLAAGSSAIIIPFIYMVGTSLKSVDQIRRDPIGLIPMSVTKVDIDGKEKPLYKVSIDGKIVEWALIKKQPDQMGLFAAPGDEDDIRLLPLNNDNIVEYLDVHWENYPLALTTVPFFKYLANTLLVTFIGMAGMLFSCSLVAYGLSRFKARGLNILFLVLLSTIMLPRQVTLIPLYVFFQRIGWVDTLLPLIVPQFFANAYNVFLLRQFFMTIPLAMDDAGKIDGANSLQRLWYIILPQSRHALVAVSIFHFLYAWNDFYEPLIFLHTRTKWTMAVGLQTFNAMYSVNTHLIMAASLMMVLPTLILFFLSQKVFTQGIVMSGVKE